MRCAIDTRPSCVNLVTVGAGSASMRGEIRTGHSGVSAARPMLRPYGRAQRRGLQPAVPTAMSCGISHFAALGHQGIGVGREPDFAQGPLAYARFDFRFILDHCARAAAGGRCAARCCFAADSGAYRGLWPIRGAARRCRAGHHGGKRPGFARSCRGGARAGGASQHACRGDCRAVGGFCRGCAR